MSVIHRIDPGDTYGMAFIGFPLRVLFDCPLLRSCGRLQAVEIQKLLGGDLLLLRRQLFRKCAMYNYSRHLWLGQVSM